MPVRRDPLRVSRAPRMGRALPLRELPPPGVIAARDLRRRTEKEFPFYRRRAEGLCLVARRVAQLLSRVRRTDRLRGRAAARRDSPFPWHARRSRTSRAHGARLYRGAAAVVRGAGRAA